MKAREFIKKPYDPDFRSGAEAPSRAIVLS